ncbi:hypothetical protein [Halomonas sp. RA08-2]|uniref:hypothetical protein n=1 Tax=Halomonas sp. RA08-2 TaxID=3440842 RepID=UPI003EEC24BF
MFHVDFPDVLPFTVTTNDRSRMKQQTQRKPLDEREKLRQFRELDDAFAEALRARVRQIEA